MDISDRIARAVELSKKSRAQLAAEIGVSPSAISQWINGGIKTLKAESASALERATGVRSAWLIDGTPPMMVIDTNVTGSSVGHRHVPLVDYVQAGHWRDIADPYVLGDAHEWLLTDLELHKDSFALEIKGDSMTPDFQPGDRVIIDVGLEPKPGDFVVAKNGEHEATFKKFRVRGYDDRGNLSFELVPLNPDYPTICSETTPVHVIGVMVEHRTYRRR